MPAVEIKPDVYWVGVNDRTTDLFEGLWPITKEGVSYNSYLINDEKKAIIDLTKSLKGDEFLAQIDEVTDVSKIDYIVVNHMEPDHSGLLRTFRRIAPRATILGSTKTKDMLESFFSIKDNVQVVNDGDTLSLGKRTLKFFSTPSAPNPILLKLVPGNVVEPDTLITSLYLRRVSLKGVTLFPRAPGLLTTKTCSFLKPNLVFWKNFSC